MAAGRLSEAVAEYREALRITPDYAIAHNNLGEALLRLGMAADALEQFREAARLDPENAESRYNIG